MKPAARSNLESAAFLVLPYAALLASACSSDPAEVSIGLTVGQETDALTRSPAVARLELVATGSDGTVGRSSAGPSGPFDLGDLPDDVIFTVEATGYDASGAAVVRGRSLPVLLGGLAGGELPLFVQRTGDWARPPGGLDGAHVAAPAATYVERYLFTTGGDDAGVGTPAASDFYDLLALGARVSGEVPRVGRSLVALGTAVLVVGDDGATWVDFDQGLYDHAALPDGLASFGDVAGGPTVVGADGAAYVVGPARAVGPTASVLRVAIDGTLEALQATTAREGAAAAWIDDVGLVLVGGSSDAPGVEILPTKGTSFQARPYPPDAVAGAALVPVGPAAIVTAGGTSGDSAARLRSLDLTCVADCAATDAGPALPAALRASAAFLVAAGSLRAVVVGEEPGDAGLTRSFLVDLAEGTADEVTLREPRRGAAVLPAPNGTLVLVGGVHADGTAARSVESFFPE
jgi:hypothetical protein